MSAVMGYCDMERGAGRDRAVHGELPRCARATRCGSCACSQPDAGPLATPFAPEPVDAPCNGWHDGRYQRIPCGSLAVVPAHAALSPAGDFTVAAYVMPTLPAKGRQAILGTWCEATRSGWGLEVDEDGMLVFRCGGARGFQRRRA